MTQSLFREDAYARDCEATVVAINDRGGVVLDRTVFYAAGGGQPGDAGTLVFDGGQCPIATTVYDADRMTIVHVPDEQATRPDIGQFVRAELDWSKRFKFMRVHSALHLLCSVVAFPVTGGQIGAGDGRLDFDIEDAGAIDKDKIAEAVNALIEADHGISERWITDAELEANPGLVRTMAVKPPMGTGRVRLIAIGEGGAVDLQPCGGTHVKSTAEIGRIAVPKIEKKGRQNRRIRLSLVNDQ